MAMSQFGTNINGRLLNVLKDNVELTSTTRIAKGKKITMTLAMGVGVLHIQILQSVILDTSIAQQLQVTRKNTFHVIIYFILLLTKGVVRH